MEFKTTGSLNTKEIKSLITSDYTNIKALINYCFITENALITLNENITHDKEFEDIKKKLVYYTSVLIEESFKKISHDDLAELKEFYSKIYKNIFKNSNIETYYPQFIMNLKNQKLFSIIHFIKFIFKMVIST